MARESEAETELGPDTDSETLFAYADAVHFRSGLKRLRSLQQKSPPNANGIVSYLCGHLQPEKAYGYERYLTTNRAARTSFLRVTRIVNILKQSPLAVLRGALQGQARAREAIEKDMQPVETTPEELWAVAAAWEELVSDRLSSSAAAGSLWLSKPWDEVRRLASLGIGEAVSAVTQLRAQIENARLASLNYGFASVRGGASTGETHKLSSPDASVEVESADLDDTGCLVVSAAVLASPAGPDVDLDGRSVVLLFVNSRVPADQASGAEDSGISLSISQVHEGHAQWTLSGFADLFGAHTPAKVIENMTFKWHDETKPASAATVFAKFIDSNGRDEATRPVPVLVWPQASSHGDEEMTVNFELSSIVVSAIPGHILDVYLCVSPENRQLVSSLALGEMENGKASVDITSRPANPSAEAASLDPSGLFQLQIRPADLTEHR